jgi:phospholipase C
MDGFVADYISFLTVELGRQPFYDEYRQIMTGYTPEQIPVLSTLARKFAVFDHWFSEVPSQTLPNRSFWTAGTSSGFVVNRPLTNFMRHNRAETIFDRLEQFGRTWKVYVLEPDPISFSRSSSRIC